MKKFITIQQFNKVQKLSSDPKTWVVMNQRGHQIQMTGGVHIYVLDTDNILHNYYLRNSDIPDFLGISFYMMQKVNHLGDKPFIPTYIVQEH